MAIRCLTSVRVLNLHHMTVASFAMTSPGSYFEKGRVAVSIREWRFCIVALINLRTLRNPHDKNSVSYRSCLSNGVRSGCGKPTFENAELGLNILPVA